MRDEEIPITEEVFVAWSVLDELTEDELEQCLKDPMWRLTHLYWIIDKEGKPRQFKPWPEQLKFIYDLWFRNIVPKARQRGFSTVVQILELDAALFTPNLRGAIIAQDEDTARRIFRDKIKFAYDRLPPTIREMQPLQTNSKEELLLAGNNSSLYVTASPRGGTLQWLHISEYGAICAQHPERAEEIQTGALPAVAKSGIVVIESTIKGIDGTFSEMCKQALARQELLAQRPLQPSEYRLHFASWWDAPEYQVDPTGIVFSSEDMAMFHRMEGEIGRDISLARRAWYLFERDITFQGDQQKMWQEYPTTVQEAFTVSNEGTWLGDVLAKARAERRITKVPYNPSLPVNWFFDIGIADDIAVWAHQFEDGWDNFIAYFEMSETPYAPVVAEMQRLEFAPWGQTFLPHDANQRRPGALEIKTPEMMFNDLGVAKTVLVPKTPELSVGNNQLRARFSRYRFDEEGCKEGLVHLQNYKKPWNRRHATWDVGYVKNGHQHAADSLRQHAQARDLGLIEAAGGWIQHNSNRPKRRRGRGGMAR